MTLTPSIKLTKRYFFSLPAGKFIASNCYKPAESLITITKLKPGEIPKGFDVPAGKNSFMIGTAPGITPVDIQKTMKNSASYSIARLRKKHPPDRAANQRRTTPTAPTISPPSGKSFPAFPGERI
jgi:hypothetical protein